MIILQAAFARLAATTGSATVTCYEKAKNRQRNLQGATRIRARVIVGSADPFLDVDSWKVSRTVELTPLRFWFISAAPELLPHPALLPIRWLSAKHLVHLLKHLQRISCFSFNGAATRHARLPWRRAVWHLYASHNTLQDAAKVAAA